MRCTTSEFLFFAVVGTLIVRWGSLYLKKSKFDIHVIGSANVEAKVISNATEQNGTKAVDSLDSSFNGGEQNLNVRLWSNDDSDKKSNAGNKRGRQKRNAVRDRNMLWKNTRISVPYTIANNFSSHGLDIIKSAFAEFSSKTCIYFVPKSIGDEDYIHIMKGDGCSSRVGRTGGQQVISLGKGCLEKSVILHELMHAIGFLHEHQRSDRDHYVTILEENVEKSEHRANFPNYSSKVVTDLDAPYDYKSVMHYGKNAFSANGSDTIVPKKSGVEIGQREGFSQYDILKINRLYNCIDEGACSGAYLTSFTEAEMITFLDSYKLGYEFVNFGQVKFTPAKDGKSFRVTCMCKGNGDRCYLDMSKNFK
uniref:Metalloendopeptidase n=1 Tax=Plectus sambesii TaxID=2011161 RepID=A0A914VAY5_9BILA